jgi:hypothetical protein
MQPIGISQQLPRWGLLCGNFRLAWLASSLQLTSPEILCPTGMQLR